MFPEVLFNAFALLLFYVGILMGRAEQDLLEEALLNGRLVFRGFALRGLLFEYRVRSEVQICEFCCCIVRLGRSEAFVRGFVVSHLHSCSPLHVIILSIVHQTEVGV